MNSFDSLPDDASLLHVFKRFPKGIDHLLRYHDAILRGSSELSIGERELIAAYVSSLNACDYCAGAHTVIASTYGIDEGLIDLAKGVVVPFEELLDEMLSLVAEDAEALGCVDEINDLRHIMQRGTSAHRQLKKYELEIAGGANHEEALQSVVDKLVKDTAEGL